MLIEKVEDFRFNGKSAIAAYLDGRQVWFKKYPIGAHFVGGGVLSAPVRVIERVEKTISLSGGGVLSAPVRIVERVEKAVSLSGEGALSASAAVRVPDIQLSSEGTLSATATPAPLILMTASGPTNASRDVTLTFPGYVPVAEDTIALWPSCKVVTAAAVWPSGWLNPRGGAPPSVTGLTEACCVHTVTPAEEAGGSNTFTLTNFWSVAQTGDVIGCVVRNVSAQIPVETNVAAGSATPATAHTLSSINTSAIRFDNSLYLGGLASSALGTYTAVPAGFTILAQSNNNQGRALVRRNALGKTGLPITGGNATFNSSTAWMGYSVVLTQDFPGTYRPVSLTGGGTLISTTAYVSASFSGGGTLSAKMAKVVPVDLSGGGTLSATVEIKNIIAAAAAGYTASRTVPLTFPGYVAKERDIVILLPSCIVITAAMTTPANWVNIRGGNSTATVNGVTLTYVHHTITAAEESAGISTFTLTNLWNANQTGEVVGIIVRGISNVLPIDNNAPLSVGTPTTSHQLAAFAAAGVRFDNDLIIGSVASALQRTYTGITAGWTSLLTSNVNQGRYLARRNALAASGVAIAACTNTANATSNYASINLLLVQDFTGTLVQPAFGGGGTLSATAAEKLWTPADIPGLAAWIDPTQDKALGRFSDNQAISSYTSYDPGGRVFVSPAGYEPIFKSAIVGGNPRIRFNWSPGNQLYSDDYNPGTAGLTFVFVAQVSGPTNYGMHIVWSNDHNYEIRNESFGYSVQVVADYQSGGPAISGAFVRSVDTDYVLLMRADMSETKVRLYINDTEQFAVNSVAAMPNVARRIYIGHRADGYYWDGLVAEVLVISGPISTTDRAKLMTYLRAKHSAFSGV